MALDLGALMGTLGLDDKPFDKTLDAMPGKLKGSAVALAAGAALVAAGVGAALSSGIEQGIELSDAKATITAQLGLTEAESARIGGVAGKLYSQAYGDSIADVNKSVEAVVSSIDGMRGATAGALEDMTAKAINFSNTFEIDVGRATQVVGGLIKNGLVSDANEGFDLLVAASQKVPAALREDLLDALDEYGPAFMQLGIDGEEAFNLLVAASAKGMYGVDKTGDALKEFTIRSTDMSTTSGAAFEAIGLDSQEMANKVLAGGDSASEGLYQVVEGLLGIEDPATRANAAIALFGTPIEDLATGDIPKFLESLQTSNGLMDDAAGAADRMGETLNGSAKVGFEQLNRTWESVIGTVGGKLVPAMQAVTDILNENPALLNVVAVALGFLAAAYVGLTVATWAANIALLANPITWIVLGIVALIAALVLLVMNWDEVVDFVIGVWGGFIGWFTDVMDGFLSWWGGIWDLVMIGAQLVWDQIVNAAASFLSWMLDLFLNWTLLGVIIKYWDDIVAAPTRIWGGFLSWISGVLVGFQNAWAVAWGAVSSTISGAWQNIVNGVAERGSALLSFVQGIPGSILGFFGGIGNWLYNAGRDLINGLLKGIGSLAGTIGNYFLKLLPSWIVAPFKAALGIKSPSTVFAGFGRNIAQGIVVGLDDEQSALDDRLGELVTVPTSTGRSGPLSAAEQAMLGGARAGVTNQAILDLRGANVGWNPDEVKARMDKQADIASALSGLDEEVPVA